MAGSSSLVVGLRLALEVVCLCRCRSSRSRVFDAADIVCVRTITLHEFWLLMCVSSILCAWGDAAVVVVVVGSRLVFDVMCLSGHRKKSGSRV